MQTVAKRSTTPLNVFAATVPAQCKLCRAPRAVRTEAEAGIRGGIPVPVIVRWLKQIHDITLTDSSVKRHRDNHMTTTMTKGS